MVFCFNCLKHLAGQTVLNGQRKLSFGSNNLSGSVAAAGVEPPVLPVHTILIDELLMSE